VDGIVGAQTLQAIEAFGDNDTLIDRICDRRMAFLKALKTWRTFGKGWSARVADVRSVGKAWASGRTPVSVSFIEGAQTKALVEDAKQPTTKGVADAATGGGIGAGALAGTLQNLQDQLTPFSSSSTWISNVVVALAIGGTALAVGGIGYRWYAQRRDARLADALNMGA
jgi:lysozyme family protein